MGMSVVLGVCFSAKRLSGHERAKFESKRENQKSSD